LIADFTYSYRALKSSVGKTAGKTISVTPKIHIVMVHVQQFLEMKGDEKGLGYWSEQAFEAVHANFKIGWEMVKVDIEQKEYLPRLTNCVSR